MLSLSFSPVYVVDKSEGTPKVIWQPMVSRFAPPRVGQGDRRVKYTGDEDLESMSPKSRSNVLTAMRMRRQSLRRAEEEEQ